MTTSSTLEACADRVKRMEVLLQSAHEFMTGEWEPDDIDRQKFVTKLAEFVDE